MHRFLLPMLVCVVVTSGCTIDAVDYTGKTCTDACPDGYRCDLTAHACVKIASSGDASNLGRDAATPPDGAVEPLDAELVEPDAGEPESDAGERSDGAVESADASAEPPDASAGCIDDTPCKPFGPYFCDLATSTCTLCRVGSHCGPTCKQCPVDLPACDTVALTCVACASDADCGGATPRCGPANTCVECLAGGDCAGSSWCNGQHHCTACNDVAHCGPGCAVCAAPTPLCAATGCVACVVDGDCGVAGGSCCKGSCYTGLPLLQRVNPSMVLAGAGSTTLTLSGENFNPCAQVMVNGQPVAVTQATATSITATVPASLLASWAALPVQVINPGVGGGPSNPNSTDLSTITLPNNMEPTDLDYFEPNTLAISEDNNNQVVLYDATALTPLGKNFTFSNQSAPAAIRAALGKLWVLTDNSELVIIADPLNAGTRTTKTFADAVKDVDIDEGGNLAVVIASGGHYQTVDATTYALGTYLSVGSSNAGVALDVSNNVVLIVQQPQTILVPVGGTVPSLTAPIGGAGAAVDHAGSRGFMGASNGVHVFDLVTKKELTAIPVAMPMHSMQFNARARSLVGVPNGNNINGESRAYAVAMVDPSLGTGTIAGYLGTTMQRGCSIMLGSQVEHEGIGVDPKRNRAFVSSSCDGKLRSFNLNALFVDLPPVTVTSLTPASVAAAGGAPVPVQIHGTAFTSAALVTFAGKSYASTFVNPTRINFTALAADLACGGTPAVVVSNPDPARWSATRNLTVTAPVPVLDTVTPTCPACVASACQTCTIVADGSSFMPGCSAVYVDGGRHVPIASSATELTASASVCAGATCGTTAVSVYVGTPGAANSATLTFTY